MYLLEQRISLVYNAFGLAVDLRFDPNRIENRGVSERPAVLLDLQRGPVNPLKAKINTRLLASLVPQEKPYEVHDQELRGFLVRVEPSDTRSFFVSYRLRGGSRTRLKLGTPATLTPAIARSEARKLLGEVARGEDPRENRRASRAKKGMTLRQFVEGAYREHIQAFHKPRSVPKTIHRLLHTFPDIIDLPLSDIQLQKLIKWATGRLKQGKSATTVNRDVADLRSALNLAVTHGHLEINPVADFKNVKGEVTKHVRVLGQDESKRLLDALNEREEAMRQRRKSYNKWLKEHGRPVLPTLEDLTFVDHLKPLVLISLNTGMRRGEVFSMTWEDVDFLERTITITAKTAKGRREREIPMNATASWVLKTWRDQMRGKTGLVFPGKTGARMDNVDSSWRKVLSKAGLVGFRWHDLRHTFGSQLIRHGVDLETVRDLLGHSDIRTTQIYLHSDKRTKKKAVALLDAAPEHDQSPVEESPKSRRR